MAKKGLVRSRSWVALATIPLAWAAAAALDWTAFLDDRIDGWLLDLRGEIEAPLKLVYVDVDSRAIEAFGASPNRAIYGGIAHALIENGGARGVGIDFIFSEYGHEGARSGNDQLRRVVEKHAGKIVLAASYATGMGSDRQHLEFPFRFQGFRDAETNDLPELPEFDASGTGARIGLIDVLEEGVGPRRIPLFVETRGIRYLHMGLQLALVHWGLEPEAVTIDAAYRALEARDSEGKLVARIPLFREQLAEVNWHSRWISPLNPRRSAAEVGYQIGRLHQGTPAEREKAAEFFQQFNDAIVLIGPADVGLADLSTTPFDRDMPVPRVGILGNLLKTIVGGIHISRLSDAMEFLVVLFLGLMVIPAFALPWRRGRFWTAGAGVVAALFFAGALILFSRHHVILPLGASFLAIVSTAGIASAIRFTTAEKQKKRIQGMFGSYVAPEMVRRLILADEEPRLGGEEVEITAFFSDVEGFSTFAEKLSPAALVALMNEYLSAVTAIILEEGGTLDKYVGDAVVAFFGAPVPLQDHALRACRAAARVCERQADLRRKWESEGDRWPPQVSSMRTRIGLNTGFAITGNMGSSQRFNYTMMGDAVNLAARLEQLGKEFGCLVLVTAETRRQADAKGAELLFRRVGRTRVKGREESVEVFELMGSGPNAVPETLECVRIFEEGLRCHEAGRIAEAAELFSRSEPLEPGVGGITPSTIFMGRCGSNHLV